MMRKITLLLIAVLIAGIILTSAVYAQIMRKPEDWSFHRKLIDDGYAINPAIAVEEDSVHVVYIDTSSSAKTFQGNSYCEVCYKGSSDGGSTWNSAVGVSGTRLIDTYFLSEPTLTSSSGSIHCVWVEMNIGTGGNVILRYKNSFDNGRSWHNDTILRTTDNIEYLEITADEDVVGVIWMEHPYYYRHMYYRISRDGGRTWDAERFLSSATDTNAFFIDGNSIYLTYISRGPPRQLMLHKSIDAGKNWSDISIPVDSNDLFGPLGIVVNGSDVHLLSSCGYIKSIDGGENWSVLNESVIGDRILLSRNDLFVLWSVSWEYAVYYTKSNDYGLTWSSYVKMFNITSLYTFDFALSENHVHLVEYETESDLFDYEIYYMKSTDEGKSLIEKIPITDHSNELRQYILGVGIFAVIAPSITLLYMGYKWRKIERKKRCQRYLEKKK